VYLFDECRDLAKAHHGKGVFCVPLARIKGMEPNPYESPRHKPPRPKGDGGSLLTIVGIVVGAVIGAMILMVAGVALVFILAGRGP